MSLFASKAMLAKVSAHFSKDSGILAGLPYAYNMQSQWSSVCGQKKLVA